jgi:hypothetical protein
MKGRKPSLFVNYGNFLCSWIRIRTRISHRIWIWIQDSQINADLGGSGSTTLGKKSLNTIY